MIVDISKDNIVITGFYQYDYGQCMEFIGYEVPDGTQVHFFQGDFSCRNQVIQQKVEIPDYLLSLRQTILAYLYIIDENEGKTIKRFTILTYPREKPPDYIDPNKPADYSRLLPVGGEVGDLLFKTSDGYEWKNLDANFALEEDLQKVSEQIPVAMTVQEILNICKV